MTFKESDYDKCLFNPFRNKFLSDIQDSIPLFKDFKDPDLGKKRVYTWIVLTFDKASPWWFQEKRLYDRKRSCALEAGFDIDGRTFEPKVEDFLLGQNTEVNNMVAAYISQLASPEYNQLIAYLVIQERLTANIMSGDFDGNVIKNLDSLTEGINRLTNKIFGSGDQDEVSYAKKALYAEAEKARIRLSPEHILKYKNDNGDLPKDFNPYGDYKVDNIKFISDEGERKAINQI